MEGISAAQVAVGDRDWLALCAARDQTRPVRRRASDGFQRTVTVGARWGSVVSGPWRSELARVSEAGTGDRVAPDRVGRLHRPFPGSMRQITSTTACARCTVKEAIPWRMALAANHLPVTPESSGFPSEVWSLRQRKAGLLPESVNDT
jgi:hypothetical protein